MVVGRPADGRRMVIGGAGVVMRGALQGTLGTPQAEADEQSASLINPQSAAGAQWLADDEAAAGRLRINGPESGPEAAAAEHARRGGAAADRGADEEGPEPEQRDAAAALYLFLACSSGY